MTAPIMNACDVRLIDSVSTLPNMSSALLDYFQPMVLVKIVKTVVNSQNAEEPTSVNFRGVSFPFNSQQLQIKSQGERDWKWISLFAGVELILNPDDVVVYRNEQYRVKAKTDYSSYGYVSYELQEDYTGAGP